MDRTAPGLLLLTMALAAGCRSPFGGRDIDLALAARAAPGPGAGFDVGQRIGEVAGVRVDFELGLAHHELDQSSALGNDWSQVWGGLRFAPPGTGSHPYGRLGVTWIRNEARTEHLDFAGDYGGAYLGGGYLWDLGPSLATGPDLSGVFVDAEGQVGGSAAFAQLAWRLVWHL